VSASAVHRIAFLTFGGLMLGSGGRRPTDLGLVNGALRPCPATPNCVSSERGTRADAAVEPFAVRNPATAMTDLTALVAAWPRTTIMTRDSAYMHAESKSRIFRFIDDVEFRYDVAAGLIHVRSASRVGRSDLGVNRTRVEGLRQWWLTKHGGT
jgi:uncharacterized protein (DUF1499 family)